MATIPELAAHADLPVETVLRVLLREPASEWARTQVAAAVAELGLPDYPRPDGHVEVLPAEPEARPEQPALPTTTGADAAVELRSLFEELVRRLDRDRRERIDDLVLTTDLITEGWRTVDRRLGRLEKMIERLGTAGSDVRSGRGGAEVRRLDDLRRPGA
jgi:hypothetical protein